MSISKFKPRFASIIQEKKNRTDEIVFSAIASWVYPKRPQLFIEALNEIGMRTKKKIILKIGGDGPALDAAMEMKNLSIRINALGILKPFRHMVFLLIYLLSKISATC